MEASKIEIKINPQMGITRIQSSAEKDIVFGMSQTKVAEILGNALQYSVNRSRGQLIEPRDGMQFTYTLLENESTSLCEIEIQISTGLAVTYESINIFEECTDDVIQKLSQFDTPTPNNGKYINFYNLGICLGGYGRKRIPEQKIIILFNAERQALMEMMFRIGGGKVE